MSAEILRRAAALMRERAEVATPGPWERGVVDRFDEGSFTVDYADVEPNVCGGIDPSDAAHVASWHPVVALAVADWLDAQADEIGDLAPRLTWEAVDDAALTAARAYLGQQP